MKRLDPNGRDMARYIWLVSCISLLLMVRER